jgi:MFS family permease
MDDVETKTDGAETKTAVSRKARKAVLAFVILLGSVSLFADMTYEGARAITGPFLGSLGASALMVGFVAGFGEFIGYVVRLVSGQIASRTGHYWRGVLLGYAVNLFSVPLLALAPGVAVAATLMITERLGRAIRTPLRDALLSEAVREAGQGWGFGLHEALDQIGATVGPLLVAFILWRKTGDYRTGFAVLLLPALISLTLVIAAARVYPKAQDSLSPWQGPSLRGFGRPFWLITLAAAMSGAGFADFALLAYHFGQAGTVAVPWIPVFYAAAMLAIGAAAFILGRLFDRFGISVLISATALAALSVPLGFLGGFALGLVATVLWGIGMGAQDSVLKAAVGALLPTGRRAVGFGLFDMVRGTAWLLGSLLLGFLYDRNLSLMVAVSLVLQLLALPILYLLKREGG